VASFFFDLFSRDLGMKDPNDLPDVFTTYRKAQEPLRNRPRSAFPKPPRTALPPFPSPSVIPQQKSPFTIPSTYDELEKALLKPLHNILPNINISPLPSQATSAHPFQGGEANAFERLNHLVVSNAISHYMSTRNGLIGIDFSTKLSGYLALGCITARQIHEVLVKFEDGTDQTYKDVEGYGKGENEGTKAIRFELLWRDYMRLCTRKFKHKLFRLSGFREDEQCQWKSPVKTGSHPDESKASEDTARVLQRFLEGNTGMGLIDASQRELYHTGYTSNRARQNVASFLTKHLGIDWRYGAEWYEMLLIDYDVSSNWSNWQYVAGVGNDPRGQARIFNPVKQAFDYDKEGEYVKSWVVEVKELEKLEHVFQAWTTPKEDWERLGLSNLLMVTEPVKRIDFSVEGKPRPPRRGFIRRRGYSRGNSTQNTTTEPAQSSHSPSSSATPAQDANQQPQPPPQPRSDGYIPTFPRGNYRGGRGSNYNSISAGAPRGRGYQGRGGFRGRYYGQPQQSKMQWASAT
jgi:deoxyribodipyrimidine photo-lyase